MGRRSAASRKRSRSAKSRSRSTSAQTGGRMPQTASGTSESVKCEVLERPALRGGEPIWQAQIQVPQGATDHSGRSRIFTIRGPPRKSSEAATQDADQLEKASVDGAKAVRTLANSMH